MDQLTTSLPSVDLVYTVSGHTDVARWAQSRRAAVADVILPLLDQANLKLQDGASILDWGCGCGRILAGWENLLPPQAALFGIDVNPALTSFCQHHIAFATVAACGYDPPLDFADDRFDLIYGASVLTHLTLPSCLRWATEMTRLVKRSGVLMISYHGSYYLDGLRERDANADGILARDGYYILEFEKKAGFPGSNDCATFMTREFIEALFGGFTLCSHRSCTENGPTDFAAHQDIALFQRW